MKFNINSKCIICCIMILVVSAFFEFGFCQEDGFIKTKADSSITLGGVQDLKEIQNSAEIESIGRFAVQEHNKNENTLLEYARVIKAKEQVVAGKIYHLSLEVIDAGKKKIYEAKVWVKPWNNFKQLQEFKHARDISSFTSSDHGVKRGH